jgi:hypothetical protein
LIFSPGTSTGDPAHTDPGRAIVYWNTVYMERAIAHLRSTGVTVPDHLLAHTLPLGWSHISLTGDYLWEQAAIAVAGFRLNTARSCLKLVA